MKRKTIYNTVLICLLIFIGSCAKKSSTPIGPATTNYAAYYGQYYIIENWITDCDGYQGFPSANITVDPKLDIVFPIHYYISPGSSLYRDELKRTDNGRYCLWTNEINNGITNHYLRFEYQIHDEPTGAWEWFTLDNPWVSVSIDANEFGNAFMIKARGDGKLDINLKDIDGNTINKTLTLNKGWNEYIILFDEFNGGADLTQCASFGLGPPDVSGNIGVRGGVDFDDIGFVFYFKKR